MVYNTNGIRTKTERLYSSSPYEIFAEKAQSQDVRATDSLELLYDNLKKNPIHHTLSIN